MTSGILSTSLSLQALQEALHLPAIDVTDATPPTREPDLAGTVTGIGSIFTYEACPATKCFKAKLLSDGKCRICNVNPDTPSTGITAILAIKDKQNKQKTMAKVFTDILSKFYKACRPGCGIGCNADIIEDHIMDILPVSVTYKVTGHSVPPILQHIALSTAPPSTN